MSAAGAMPCGGDAYRTMSRGNLLPLNACGDCGNFFWVDGKCEGIENAWKTLALVASEVAGERITTVNVNVTPEGIEVLLT